MERRSGYQVRAAGGRAALVGYASPCAGAERAGRPIPRCDVTALASADPDGFGAFGYELVEGWGSLPEPITLGQVAVATDSHDNVYLFNRGDQCMVVLD